MTFSAFADATPDIKPATPFVASVAPSFERELDVWSRMADAGAALPFQRRAWLDAWAATKGRHEAVDLFAMTIRDASGLPLAGLPLVRDRAGLTRIRFADDGLTDYNAPVLAAAAPDSAIDARHLWKALLRALPPCDAVVLERMPERVGPLVNPFVLVPGVRIAGMRGVALDMPGSYEEWERARPRRYRMELGRCARLFDAMGGARFLRITDKSAEVFAALEHLQRHRIAALGLPYRLDGDDERNFYRAVLAGAGQDAVLTALVADGEVIAALLGLREKSWFVMLRIGAAEAYARVSPARQLIVRTMEMLRADGVTTFDFGLGDYKYKRKLGGEPVILHDLVAPRSLLGTVDALSLDLKSRVRDNPRLHGIARRIAAFARGAKERDRT